MAISQQALQNVEFLELRRVFKKESNDIEKIDNEILDVLKDNNAILKDLVDKLDTKKISTSLSFFKPKKEKSEDDDFQTLGTFKDFTKGIKERLQEYKDFFFGVKEKPLIETKDQELIPEVVDQQKILPYEEKIPTPKFMGRGEQQEINSGVPKLEAPKLDVPKLESPKLDVPKLEAPKLDIPKLEAPKIEATKLDVPKLEAPKLIS